MLLHANWPFVWDAALRVDQPHTRNPTFKLARFETVINSDLVPITLHMPTPPEPALLRYRFDLHPIKLNAATSNESLLVAAFQSVLMFIRRDVFNVLTCL